MAETRWVLAPVEPTEEIIEALNAGFRSTRRQQAGGMSIDSQWRGEYAPELAAYRTMIAGAPPVPDAVLERMAQAHFNHERPPGDTAAGSTTRWATWAECCEMLGWKERQIAAMRAAVGAGGE